MNELQTTENNQEVVLHQAGVQVVRDTKDYTIVKLENGKFEKRMKYRPFSTYEPKSEEEKIELYNILNGADEDNENVVTMATSVGEVFTIEDVIVKPYETFDEDTGEVDYGVITYLITDEGKFLTTSSKSVYYSIKNIMGTFDLPVNVRVTGTRRQNGTQINIVLVK